MHRGSSLSESSSSYNPPDAGIVESSRRASCPMDTSPRASRSSVLPSAVFPYLRRLDTGQGSPQPLKDPLLVLKLSSQSFLDTEVNSDNVSRLPLYTTRTNGTRTTIVRSDPWEGEIKTADIEWPVLDPSKGKGKELDGVTIQMRSGRRKPADTFLRPGSILSAPRKFKIPGYSHSLKWKAVGSSYWCLAASAKGPIAILEPATADTVPPRLKVFETLHDKYEARPMMAHQGVSVILLDYLLVSSLLLTTDIQEWMVVQKYDAEAEANGRCTPEVSGCDDNGPRSAPPASTSALQWRKIIYGEPLFPKRQSSASTAHLRFPTHASRMAKIFNGDPIYPTLSRGSTPDFFSSSSDSESEGETAAGDAVERPPSTPPTRVPSPSAESILYPLTTATAPAHPYLDPSFYNAFAVPPVPPLPAEYASSNNARPGSASGARRPRELPRPPKQQSTAHRSRSSPPRPVPIQTNMPSGTQSASSSPDRRRPSVDSMLSRTASLRSLPRPPPTPIEASSSHPPLRHSQSSTRPLNSQSRTREKRSSQYAQRTLPPTPIAVSHPDWMTPTTTPTTITHPDWMTGLRIRKRSHNELYHWFSSDANNEPLPPHVDDHRQSIFDSLDCPPPAYNSAEFAAGTSISVSPSSPLPVPSIIPPSPSTARP